MRILHFIPSLHASVGGPARAVLDLSATLAARGMRVTIATTESGEAPLTWTYPRARVPHLVLVQPPALPARTFSPRQVLELGAAIASQDVIHLHGVWDLANLQIADIARRYGIPYVISPRGMLARWSMRQSPIRKQIFLRFLGRRWLRQAARIHFTAEAERDDALRWTPKGSSTVVIPNLLDLATFRRLPDPDVRFSMPNGSSDPRFTILFISRIHPKKGLDLLIAACALLKRDSVDTRLIVAGDGDPKYVASMQSSAAQHGLTSADIVFIGAVRGEMKLTLYRSCNVMALPTQQENFGFVFIEALACGLPIVTTQVDLHEELQRSGAVTISPRTALDFCKAIRSLYEQRHLLMATGTRARSWVLETFAADGIAARFESMYAGVATERFGFPRGKLLHSTTEA